GLSGHMEINQGPLRMIWLANNLDGYQQLLRLSTLIQHDEPITLETLQEMEENISSIVPLDQWLSYEENQIEQHVFDIENSLAVKNLFIGMSEQTMMYRAICEKINVPKIAMSDVRYLHKHDRAAYSCLRAMDQGIVWKKEMIDKVEGTFLPSFNELEETFREWPELIHNMDKLAEACHVELPLYQRLLPKYPISNENTADDFLENLCLQSLKERYQDVTQDIMDRFHYELDVIQSMGFSDYFLIVWDFVKYAKENHIMVGPGRGSAAGSLIAYLLDITEVDPIQYDLLF